MSLIHPTIGPPWFVVVGAFLGLAFGTAACKEKAKAKPSDAQARPTSPAKGPSTPPPEVPPTAEAPASFEHSGDEAKALGDLGALPAWSTVLERYRLLARRDQSGLAVGLLVDHEGSLRLVDESEGQGSLSIPVHLPALIKVAPPVRVAVWGAWKKDEASAFVWSATRIETLSAAPSAPEFAPGLRGRDKAAPEELHLASTVTRRGGAISFSVHQRQERMGEGWLISDSPGLPAVARLLLPGERAPYGDQSRVSEVERWQLQSKHGYWLEIGQFRPASGGALPVYRARTPPFRFTRPQAKSSP